MKKKRIGISAVIIILLIIVASFGTIVRFATDFLWFQELTYVSVFLKKLFTQLTLGVPFFIVIMLLTYGYLRLIKNDYYKRLETEDLAAVSEKTINRVSLGISAVFAFVATMMITTTFWFEILKFINATPYGTADPVFNIDISFFLFKFPLIRQIVQAMMMLIFGFIALTVLDYLFLMSVRRPKLFGGNRREADPDNVRRPNFGGNFGGFGQMGEQFSSNLNQMYTKTNGKELLALAGRQIIILGSCFFLMLAANFFLQQFSLLYSSRGFLFGAGFTDINVTLWQYRILVVLSLLSIFTFGIGLKRKKYKLALGLPVIMIIVSAGGAGLAYAVQNFIVTPDELKKEGKYIEYNIGMTQKAYDLNKIEITDFPANNNLTKEDIANNIETIENIRINDYEPAKQFYNQRQSIRQYYLFNDVDVDRYMVNGRYTQVFLSSREIDEGQLQDQWLTKHIKYTHGYGVTLSKVNSITASGQPDMMVEGIPPVSKVDEIQITRPEIYYGELSNDYVITNTNETEFDYPSGESNVYTQYEGTGGIRLNFLNRILFAIREQSIQMLVSTNVTGNSKILVNRNIMDRAQKIAPFISYDKNPYSVIVDGEHYWMIDAYTTSSYFPYSAPYTADSSVNYIRNSIKVVIDAYDGDTKYYVVDESDPLAMTLEKIFPDLFRPASEMPEGIRAHMRYPENLFEIQANVYKRYHMTDYRVFYQGEDIWDISKEIYKQETISMRPNYYIMKMPGEEDVEFTISIPFTPMNKPNMSALMVARNDGENYGKLVLFRLPKDKTIYSPMQIDAQVDQDTEISKEFSLWGQQGSSYLRGNMFVVPIEESFLYVEPIYLQADNENSLPEVKRVIVAYGDKIAYQPTLALALESLFGQGAGDGIEDGGGASGEAGQPAQPNTEAASSAQLIAGALQAYNNALEAQRNGDWAAYGEYLKQMEAYLKQLSGLSSSQPVDLGEPSNTDQSNEITGESI